MKPNIRLLALVPLAGSLFVERPAAAQADVILHHGKVVTVDKAFSIHQALAIEGNRILEVGTDESVMKPKGPRTAMVDLQRRMVLPGLMDSHTHPQAAALTEFDHPVPQMDTIQDVPATIPPAVARASAIGMPVGRILRSTGSCAATAS
jgi:hypothetical protein